MTDGIVSPYQSENFDDEPQDDGHQRLVADLEGLLEEATECHFHDFEGEKYPAPKQALMGALNLLIARVEQGWYDN